MRWKPKQIEMPEWAMWLFFWWVIIPLVAILWLTIALPEAVRAEKRKRFGPYPDRWQKWFAWRPVKWSFMESDLSGWVWLETIERKEGFYTRDGCDYRPAKRLKREPARREAGSMARATKARSRKGCALKPPPF